MKTYLKFILFAIILGIVISFNGCGGCSKSGLKNKSSASSGAYSYTPDVSDKYEKGKTVIKMTKQGGVCYIPCKINGSEMKLIFDTGASDITMSLTEALFLYKQGKLTDDDFLGTQHYQIANGQVEEGTVVRLKTVELGNRTLYNVQASIVHNLQAPLLLGQSALEKFGKISIDYNNNVIIFE